MHSGGGVACLVSAYPEESAVLRRRIGKLILVLAADIIICLGAQAQNTYHFHKETASTGYSLLSPAGPDAAATTLTTANLKSLTGNVWIGNWASASGVPNTAGAVLANSIFQFPMDEQIC